MFFFCAIDFGVIVKNAVVVVVVVVVVVAKDAASIDVYQMIAVTALVMVRARAAWKAIKGIDALLPYFFKCVPTNQVSLVFESV